MASLNLYNPQRSALVGKFSKTPTIAPELMPRRWNIPAKPMAEEATPKKVVDPAIMTDTAGDSISHTGAGFETEPVSWSDVKGPVYAGLLGAGSAFLGGAPLGAAAFGGVLQGTKYAALNSLYDKAVKPYVVDPIKGALGLKEDIGFKGASKSGVDPDVAAEISTISADEIESSATDVDMGMGDPVGDMGGQANASGESEGGDDKVLCAEMYRQGYLPKAWYEADEKYAATVDKDIIEGYQAWAIPYTRLMQKNRIFTYLAYPFVMCWAKHMAFLMKAEDHDSLIGSLLEKAGKPICRKIYQIKTYVKEVFA